MLRLYLDSSTVVKRYVTEPGTQTVDFIFDLAESGELAVAFSAWNIGEVFGVLDERRRRGWLSEGEFTEALKLLSNELLKLRRLRVLEIVPIFTSTLTETWNIILTSHVYEADALQITTCKHTQSNALLSSDGNLVETSRNLGIQAFDIVKDEKELLKFIKPD